MVLLKRKAPSTVYLILFLVFVELFTDSESSDNRKDVCIKFEQKQVIEYDKQQMEPSF